MAIRTKIFYHKPLSTVEEQLENFCNKKNIGKAQIVEVSLAISENGNNRILLVYEDATSSKD